MVLPAALGIMMASGKCTLLDNHSCPFHSTFCVRIFAPFLIALYCLLSGTSSRVVVLQIPDILVLDAGQQGGLVAIELLQYLLLELV